MDVTVRHPDDLESLERLVRTERSAKQRDRFRAVLLALKSCSAVQIAAKLDRSRRFVQTWVYRYRDEGIDGLRDRPRPGQPTKLARELEEASRDRIDAGPRPEDGVCTWRGADVMRLLEREFSARYTLGGAYDLLHRLGFSCLRPRPRHEQNDLEAMRQWLERAPLFSSANACNDRRSGSRSGPRMKPASVSKAR